MLTNDAIGRTPPTSTRNHRLHALCPYFAMFPPAFAQENILAFTRPGDLVCDPFSGRGTTLLEALLNDRRAIASDINPVAWCLSSAKAKPASLNDTKRKIDQFHSNYDDMDYEQLEREADALPEFFTFAFHRETLKQLLFLRRALDLRQRVDRFIAGILLGHLHGELDRSNHYLSNQMPHTISTKPAYSINYWKSHNLRPPNRDVFNVLLNRAEFRLSDGIPSRRGTASRCDVRAIHRIFRDYIGTVDAIITSPPYLNVTRFEEDQWLRLWFVGGPANPTYGRVSRDDRHSSAYQYWDFLAEAWRSVALLLKPKGHLVCRIGTGQEDPEELTENLIESVRDAWPKAKLTRQPVITGTQKRQTTVLNAGAIGCRYEIDFSFVCPQ
jgi:DNA methylase